MRARLRKCWSLLTMMKSSTRARAQMSLSVAPPIPSPSTRSAVWPVERKQGDETWA
jgi:hypothetical protein